MSELNDDHLDRALREKFGEFGQHPSERVWNNISRQLPSARPRFPKSIPLVLCAFLGAIVGTQLPQLPLFHSSQPATETVSQTTYQAPQAAAHTAVVTQSATNTDTAPASAAPVSLFPSASVVRNQTASTRQASPAFNASVSEEPLVKSLPLVAALTINTAPDSIASNEPAEKPSSDSRQKPAGLPLAMAVQIPVGVKSVVELENQLLPLLADNSQSENSRTQLLATLRAEKAALSALISRNDSLLLAVEGSFVKETQQTIALDSSVLKPALPKWSLALSFAPEQNFLSLSAPYTDTLVSMRNNRETGRSGYNAAFQVERRLNERLSVGAGFGYSSYGSEFRMTTRETELSVSYDTTHTFDTTYYTTVTTIPIIKIDSVLTLEPVYNSNAQVVGWDTVYVVLHDTVYSTFTTEDIIASQHTTVNPKTSRHEVTREQILRPRYHFVTLPVMLRYRLTPGARWWADVGFGGQLQLFRGGTHAVSNDGRNFRMERVKPNEGPFRPVNLALMGNLALNYGLTKSLSISMAPALRWQVQSVYKKETGLQQRPVSAGLQFGLRYTL
jgi:hypothetical protein